VKLAARHRLELLAVLLVAVISVLAVLVHGHTIAVLDPMGLIGSKERGLMVFAVILSLFVVLPVFVMTGYIAWQYRASNTKANYQPDWDHNRLAETIWWGFPILLIFILSIVTWNSSHSLDPSKAIASDKPAMTIEVVALQWKWLFIYPEQQIATVNYVQMPVGTPVDFVITSDAPMNSFWIPQLGGQIYAMSGMSTQLHLVADRPGKFAGSSANLSGQGFAGMKFTAEATSNSDFDQWVSEVAQTAPGLTMADYDQLAKASQNNPPTSYSLAQAGLYAKVIAKYASSMPQSHFHAMEAAR
jgi:cytochrome o ubiquinol oxidase subunit 2